MVTVDLSIARAPSAASPVQAGSSHPSSQTQRSQMTSGGWQAPGSTPGPGNRKRAAPLDDDSDDFESMLQEIDADSPPVRPPAIKRMRPSSSLITPTKPRVSFAQSPSPEPVLLPKDMPSSSQRRPAPEEPMPGVIKRRRIGTKTAEQALQQPPKGPSKSPTAGAASSDPYTSIQSPVAPPKLAQPKLHPQHEFGTWESTLCDLTFEERKACIDRGMVRPVLADTMFTGLHSEEKSYRAPTEIACSCRVAQAWQAMGELEIN